MDSRASWNQEERELSHKSAYIRHALTLAACENLELVSKLLGHKSVKTTQRYADVLLDMKIEAVSRMANLL